MMELKHFSKEKRPKESNIHCTPPLSREEGSAFNSLNALSKYKNIGSGNPLNVAQNIEIDDEDINIPLNLPAFIIGSKNAGKSTIISTLINAEKANNIYKRIIYVYSDHVDSTLAETLHKTIIRVPLGSSIEFITKYFNIKTEYISWVTFLGKLRDQDIIDGLLELKQPTELHVITSIYTDNIIDEYIRNFININEDNEQKKKKIDPVLQLIEKAKNYVRIFSKEFAIKVGDVKYYLEGLRYFQYDQLIIDDVGVSAPYLFPTSKNKSPLYKFMTIARHILLGIIIAGQDIQQLPLYARKEINTFLFGVGVYIQGISSVPIPDSKQKEIIQKYDSLEKYEFIVYNGINNSVSLLKI